MNKFVKAVVATGLLAAVGTPAMAAIDIGDNGELVLTMLDSTASRSTILGLNTNLANVLPSALAGQSGTVLSFDVTAQVTALLASGATLANLQYNVTAIDGVASSASQSRFGRKIAVTGAPNSELLTLNNNGLQTITNFAGQTEVGVNAGNGDGVVVDPASTFYADSPSWGATLGGVFPQASGAFGSELGFFYYASSDAYSGTETVINYGSRVVATREAYEGVWSLSGSNGTYSLTYTAAAAPVPLPAAAWLLLSGLTGLGVIGRRRREQAAA
jgi:hypothetical protein